MSPANNVPQRAELSPAGLLLRILWIALGAVLLAAIVAPWIYFFAQFALPVLHGFPFRRFFSRSAQVILLVGLLPLLLHWRRFSLSRLGLGRNPLARRDFFGGFLAALLPAVVVAGIWIACDVYRPRKDLSWLPLARVFLTAGVVSLLEEFLFRGILLGLAVQAWGRLRGVLVTTVVFAAVHFLHPPKVDVPVVTWASGFDQIAAIFRTLPDGRLTVLGFATLLMAGGILAVVTVRTRSLWAAIGLHAGWILAQQSLNWLAKFRPRPPEALLPWVGPSLVSGAVPTGLVSLAALGITLALLVLVVRPRPRCPSDPPTEEGADRSPGSRDVQ